LDSGVDGADLRVWSALPKSSVQRLASPAEVQVAYIRDELGVGDMADELALEFDDAFRPVAPLLGEIPETRGLLSALRRVDSALEGLDDSDWTADALRTSPRWAEVRRLASAALDERWPG
jgi:hypothetical protein